VTGTGLKAGRQYERAALGQGEVTVMELSASELSAIIAAIPGDFAVYRADGGKLLGVYASPGLPAISGMSPEEYEKAVSSDAGNIVLDSDRPYIASVLERMLRDGGDAEYTYRVRHKTKGFVWIHAKARRIGDIGGCPAVMTLFFNNSFETEEHAALLDNFDELVYVVDSATKEMLYANRKCLKTWGRRDVIGKICHKCINGLDEMCPWCSMPKMKDGYVRCEDCYAPKIGRWFTVECRDMQWFGRAATAVYCFDVTEQKKRQQDVEVDRESLKTTVENIPVGIGVCSIAGDKVSMVAVNARMTELMGAGFDRFSSADSEFYRQVHPDDRNAVVAAMKKCAEPDARSACDYRFMRAGENEYSWYRLDARTTGKKGAAVAFICISDITAERKAQQENMRMRRLYEAAVDEAKLVVWEYDMRSKKIIMSDNEFARYDYSKFNLPQMLENVPESLVPYIDGKDVGKFLEMYRKIENGAPRASCEVWYKPNPGQELRCERISYMTVYGDDGRPVSAYGIGQNITARKIEELNYIRFYKQLAEVNPSSIGVFRLNLTRDRCGGGQSKYARALELQSSGTASGFFAANAANITDSAIRDEALSRFNIPHMLEAFKSGKTSMSADYPILTGRGTVMWIRGYVNMLQNPVNGDIEAIANAIDITEKKKNEQVIQNLTEKKFDYIAIIELESGMLEFCNKRPDILVGEIKRRDIYEKWRSYVTDNFIPDGEKERYRKGTDLETVRRELDGSGDYSFSFVHVKYGRTTRRQLQYGWLDKKRGEIIAIRTDITAAYRAEQERIRALQEALSMAEEANRAKSEFVSRISHDIRTPISIISSMTDFALADARDEKALNGDLMKIKSANAFLLSLINDVLDISKIDSGKIELNPTPYTYAEHSANIRNVIEPMCAQKGLKCVIVRKRKTGTIVADKTRINQITLNIISNAVKYTPAGGTVTYTSDSEDLPDNKIRFGFEISDTGIGMSEEFQKKMFEPFTQEYDNPLRPKTASGTGLGLSIVRKMVDLMGGTLSVESRLGKGTTVKCSIVFPDAERDPAYKDAEAESGEKKALRELPPLHGKVLLAEDNPINTEIASRVLGSFGLAVDCAENGLAAVKMFEGSKAGEYGAVIMDIQMPVMNGYEATEAIRALGRPDAKDVPIIAMTADAFADAMERGRKAGMSGYMTKPIDPEKLRRMLSDMMTHGG
jgi:signal transduction histidine kinase